MGCDVVDGYAALFAQTLHVQGLFVIDDIDHVSWGHTPYGSFGVGLIDFQVLDMIKLCDDDVAIGSLVRVQVRQRSPKPDKFQKVVHCYISFDFNKWMSLQLTPEVVNVNDNSLGTLAIGSTEKSSMKPSTEAARLAFEKKLNKRWLLMKNKPHESLQSKPGFVGIEQTGMVTRDQEKIEHVPNTCWGSFTTWRKPSERY